MRSDIVWSRTWIPESRVPENVTGNEDKVAGPRTLFGVRAECLLNFFQS